ncbi:hypothetical protein [Caldimonas aquatica]|uniref:Uncharacterized protein n=1 Tax=Caldimonas aquatica TaxID=376175 RepID=A0ABY6MSW7_9BURK|nr:hypothetical protein [Schlegelella aquatica]UZD55106.1 hypothetical protein OMP39_00465 [Schlegelella aquatica]
MKKIVVLIDDAAHAQARLPAHGPGEGVQWVFVACAPRLTHRASKWVAHGAREHWRAKWAARLFEAFEPCVRARGWRYELVVARGPLPPLLSQLGGDEVIDARRPKDASPAPVPPFKASTPGSLWLVMLGTWFAAEAA